MAADATIQGLRATLEEERDSLRAPARRARPRRQGLDYDPNFADSSQVTAERGENEALVNKLVEALRDVEHALEKFDTDTYGVCEQLRQADRRRPASRPSRRPGSASTAPPQPPPGADRPTCRPLRRAARRRPTDPSHEATRPIPRRWWRSG